MARFVEPGRAAFELSLAISALSLLFPWLVVGALGSAARARQKGSRRAGRAAMAAIWCGVLGLLIRQYLGFGMFP
jgi:hypothetical protein